MTEAADEAWGSGPHLAETPRGGVFETRYWDWDNVPLPEGVDIAAAMQALESKDWKAQFTAQGDIQRLARHNPSCLFPHIDTLCPLLAKTCGNLRSGIANNGLLTVIFLARGLADSCMGETLPAFLPQILKHAAADKAFVAETARDAGRALVSPSCLSPEVFVDIFKFCGSKSARLVAVAADLLLSAIESSRLNSFRELDDDTHRQMVPILVALLQAKLSVTKQSARQIASLARDAYASLHCPDANRSGIDAPTGILTAAEVYLEMAGDHCKAVDLEILRRAIDPTFVVTPRSTRSCECPNAQNMLREFIKRTRTQDTFIDDVPTASGEEVASCDVVKSPQ
eukprot:GHVU01105412.1.p1 GENE.GHVU01105412.1~~GHVU01105412.1.p1  ORF type:complete len:341 (-),score=30.55 GHVU01105412.1:586-1608(-)